MNDARWVATWACLWGAMGSRKAGRSRWQRPRTWAAMIGASESDVSRLLYAATGAGLMRLRRRPESGRVQPRAVFARTDVVSVNERFSDREIRASVTPWRWEYDLVEMAKMVTRSAQRPAAHSADTRGEDHVLAAVHVVAAGGPFVRKDAWAAARSGGQAKSTFYAAWDRLVAKGVLTRRGPFWSCVAPE